MRASRRPDPIERVRAAGGIVRSARLVHEGVARDDVATAVDRGALVRVRRRWVALPMADPLLLAAAREGVTISCVTAAVRLGLWVTARGEPHVSAPAHAGRIVAEGMTVHLAQPLVPRHPDALVDEPENALSVIASCQPFEHALATWESAIRQRVIDPAALARMRLPGPARAVLAEAQHFADSGLETFAVSRLRWMKVRLVPQAWLLGHRVDLLIGERLVLQIDGGHHVGAQRESDIRHDAELMLRGYHVIRVGYAQMMDDWPAVQSTIMKAVAQGLHLALR